MTTPNKTPEARALDAHADMTLLSSVLSLAQYFWPGRERADVQDADDYTSLPEATWSALASLNRDIILDYPAMLRMQDLVREFLRGMESYEPEIRILPQDAEALNEAYYEERVKGTPNVSDTRDLWRFTMMCLAAIEDVREGKWELDGQTYDWTIQLAVETAFEEVHCLSDDQLPDMLRVVREIETSLLTLQRVRNLRRFLPPKQLSGHAQLSNRAQLSIEGEGIAAPPAEEVQRVPA